MAGHEAYVILDTKHLALLSSYGTKMPAIYSSLAKAKSVRTQRCGKSNDGRWLVGKVRLDITETYD